jgi:hypothetical protein
VPGTHTHRQHCSHIPNKQRKQAEEVVTALNTKDDPPKDSQTIVTEICRVLIDVFYKYFKQFSVLNVNVNVNVFQKKCMSWFE